MAAECSRKVGQRAYYGLASGRVGTYGIASRLLDAVDDGQLVPAGQGDTDWTGVVKTCTETNVEYGFVEQERWTRDPFDCMREALDWLDGQRREAAL